MEQASPALNIYGDSPKFSAQGHGADIATQRADDLDLMAIRHLASRPDMFTIDLACGAGGQSLRMANAGADVLAMDIIDFSKEFKGYDPQPGKLHFVQFDMTNLADLNCVEQAEVIVCQRAIHYFKFKQAVCILSHMKRLLANKGKIYLSASGIGSELGIGYQASPDSLEKRFGHLHPDMADKHGIHAEVCLYAEEDMNTLVTMAGLKIESLYSSAFGNVKAVITHR